MIQGFQQQTQPLSQYEQEILVPIVVRGLQTKVGKANSITNKEICSALKEKGYKVDAFDALSLAESAGSSKAVNLVLMGCLSKYFDFSEEEWMTAIEKSVPPKFLEMNKKAFALGANK